MNKTSPQDGAREKFIQNFFLAEIGPTLKQEKLIKKGTAQATEKDLFLVEIGQTLGELESCIELIELMPQLITSHSSRQERKGFTRTQQHRRNIEWYFHEMYILKERVKKFIRLLKKYARKVSIAKESSEISILNGLIEEFEKSLKNITKIRGLHVHERKFEDDDLRHLEYLDYFINKGLFEDERTNDMIADMKFILKMDRRKWRETITNNNSMLRKIFDDFYYILRESGVISLIRDKLELLEQPAQST